MKTNGSVFFDGLKLAVGAAAIAICFKLIDVTLGIVPALIMVATIAALIPLTIERRRLIRIAYNRARTLAYIQKLKESATTHREWYPNHLTVAEMKARFSWAQEKALALHQELVMRAGYLDECEDRGIKPLPGADWQDLMRLAIRIENDLEGASWCCEEGVKANAGLLDPHWSLDFVIHTGVYEEPVVEVAPPRVIVPMTEFEHMRQRRKLTRMPGKLIPFSHQEADGTG